MKTKRGGIFRFSYPEDFFSGRGVPGNKGINRGGGVGLGQ